MQKAIYHLKGSDPVLGAIIERVGPFKMAYSPPTFHNLARSIVYQQLHGKAAATIFSRLLAATGDPLTHEGVLKLRPAKMRSLGVSPQKTSYIRDLARRTRAGEVDFDSLPGMPDEAVVEHLTQVKGIGVWTTHMFLMFALRRPDVLPIGDFGIRMAIKRAYGLPDLPKPPQIEEIARPWRPWASVACWYLWRSVDGG
jgi:DNA-3-methyladenine glycosylase II